MSQSFDRLLQVMDELREQCPWDKKQTIHSLRTLTIEEMYELADAVTDENWQGIKEELGDLLLHIVFYARIGREQNAFTMDEIIHALCDKLIERHPHIYGNVTVHNEEDVKRNWEQIKIKNSNRSVLSGVPVSLPALVKATRIQEKCKQVGFEWEHKADVWKKVQEELAELQEAVQQDDKLAMEEELGDVFFSLANYARFIHTDAETALEKTNKKFVNRFKAMELLAKDNGKTLYGMSLEEMDALWNEVKKMKL